ncbi:hypothetical protein [Halomonas sp. NO4]|uniref:hypothetical protein n=1 Tax=Halomonas sp. NO4 TaxID=2484813 RepID=UPI001969A49D|nr:hypothetical protein [Halomonas sp. NO4]
MTDRASEVQRADVFLDALDAGRLTDPADLLEALSLKWFRLGALYHIKDKYGVIQQFRPNGAQRQRYLDGHTRDLILKARQLGFCVDPSTRVLTANLRWVAIADLQPGQAIIAVDEHTPGGKGKARKMRTATVERVGRVTRQAYRITLDDGREVVCTDKHPWLTRKVATDAKWRSLSGEGNQVVGKIEVGTQVRWVAKPWDGGDYADGWFGGMLDGEGSMALPGSSGAEVNVAQVEGPALARLEHYLHERGYHYRTEADTHERDSKHGSVPVHKLCISRMDEMFRLVGQTRPSRFVGRRFWEGKELPGKRNGGVGWATVTAIEKLGEQEMVDLQTSTGTYIAEGFVSHNTTFEMLDALDDCLFIDNYSAGCICHKLDDARDIFDNKIAFAYRRIAPAWHRILRELGIRIPKARSDKSGAFHFDNGSQITVSTSYRGGTLQRLHVSEFGKICREFPTKAKEIVTGAFEAVGLGNPITLESTAEGREGYFYDYCELARQMQDLGRPLGPMDWQFHFFPWWAEPEYRLDPEGVVVPQRLREYFEELEHKHGIKTDAAQQAWYAKKYETLQDDMMREYPSTPDEAFAQSVEGAYYGTQMRYLRKHGRIGAHVEVNPTLPVYTAWDLGMNDTMAIWFCQVVGREVHLVDYLEDSGEGIEYYADLLNQRGYRYGGHFAPHDIEVRELGTGQSRSDVARQYGIRFETVPAVSNQAEGVQAVRNFLPMCWIAEEACHDGIKALDNYRKEWDEKRGCYKEKPRHDWASHGAKALETLARSGLFERTGLPTPRPARERGGWAAHT